MSISITCPECFQQMTVSDGLAGKKVRCKECKGVVEVAVESEPESEPETEEVKLPARTRSRGSRSTASVGLESGGNAAKGASGQSRWSEVPWKPAGIPMGIGLALFALSRVLPMGWLWLIALVLNWLWLLGCGLTAAYMLVRVSSRLGSDISMAQITAVKRLGRSSGLGGGNAIVFFLTLGFVWVAIKGMIKAPGKTIPWFLMMVIGITGFVWTVKRDNQMIKARRNQPNWSGTNGGTANQQNDEQLRKLGVPQFQSSDDMKKWYDEKQKEFAKPRQ
jgi:predicted Zn finger-like uncharacterized protein